MDFARIIFSHHHLQHRRVVVLKRDYHDDNYNFLFPQHYANVAHLLALSGDWTLDLMFSIVHIGLDWIGVQAEWAAYPAECLPLPPSTHSTRSLPQCRLRETSAGDPFSQNNSIVLELEAYK